MSYALGLDFGTNSARALIVRCADGFELASAVAPYPSGVEGILLDATDHHLARQHPGDYLVTTVQAVTEAIRLAPESDRNFSPSGVIGIGVDSTGSSPIPVNERNEALGCLPEWKDHLAAQCWLWKDHTSHAEAARITELARERRPHYVAKCGNTYSSEWWWSKILHCLHTSPDVFAAAYSWVELADWVPSVLAGISAPKEIKRGICAAGHKAMFCEEWGGLPDEEFLSLLDPQLATLRSRLYDQAYDASESAGTLSSAWAEKLSLPQGIPIAIGKFDVHYGAIGCGVDTGTLIKVIGTSTCDCAVMPADHMLEDIPGICGMVNGSILPGYYGLEAGQSAVGDIFKWWVEVVCQGESTLHASLTEEASQLAPGQSGLLALDWNNGNRTVLVDQRLTGLLLGQTLHTSPAEVYRALIEATAFGARMIIQRFAEYGVPVERIVCAGGIAEKNPLLMQIYADVTGSTMLVSASGQTCALGAAITASVLASPEAGGHASLKEAQSAMAHLKDIEYQPNPEAKDVYDQLFRLYQQVHDAFGGVNAQADLGDVMKELLTLKDKALA